MSIQDYNDGIEAAAVLVESIPFADFAIRESHAGTARAIRTIKKQVLHCYSNSTDTVIAASVEDAIKVWEETTSENWQRDYADSDEWGQEPDEKVITITNVDESVQPKETHTCREWADKRGRGWLSSTEW